MVKKKGVTRTIAAFIVSTVISGCQTASMGTPHPFTTVFYADQPASVQEFGDGHAVDAKPSIATNQPPDFSRF